MKSPIPHGGNPNAVRRRLGLGDLPLVDFSASLNPSGPSPRVIEAARKAIDGVGRYPEPDCPRLVARLAEKHGVPEDRIVVGAGTTELIGLIGQCLREVLALHAEEIGDPKMTLSHLVEPTYGEYRRASVLNLIRTEIWSKHVLGWEQDFLPRSASGIFWTGHPNNPTGRAWDREGLLKLVDDTQGLLVVVDEAFLPFLADESDRTVTGDVVGRANLLVLRSLTKIHAIPGLRVGYAVTSADMVMRLRQFQNPWTVSAPAEAAALAALDDAEEGRHAVVADRPRSGLQPPRRPLGYPRPPPGLAGEGTARVGAPLAELPAGERDRYGLVVDRPARSPRPPGPPRARVLRLRRPGAGVAAHRPGPTRRHARPPADRPAISRGERPPPVRPAGVARLGAAELSRPTTPSLMVLGTASHVGKSLLSAAFCRLFAEEGRRVAPFKAQNMALNSFVTPEGGEIGRAQVAQAEASGIEPHVDMNPILLKPMGGVSQVVLEGAPIGLMSARDYYAAKDRLWPRVTAAYDRLAGRSDLVVLEGAGSPVEINLAEHDLTNFRMARHAKAAVVVVADIERGGVFAQLVGTWELMEPEDRPSVVGWIINKFRGDASLLDSGLDYLRRRTGVPVLGVLPHRPDLQVDQEDSLGIDETASDDVESESGPDSILVAVARLPGLSNFTDFAPLARFPGVRLKYVESPKDLDGADLVVLPGTKTTVRDLDWLRRSGLAAPIVDGGNDPDGPTILGICGGFQMLGRRIDDPLGVESDRPSVEGLGLLDVTTEFAAEKARHRVRGASRPDGQPVVGYEIHMGRTDRGPGVPHWLDLIRQRDGEAVADGAVSADGRVFGTYVHGLFDSFPFAAAFVDRCLRRRRGLGPIGRRGRERHRLASGDRYRHLGDWLRSELDLGPIRSALRLRGLPG